MAEFVIPPSPNWYLSNVLCVGADGCLVYGATSNSIAILTPVDNSTLNIRFQISSIRPAHKLKVTCISLCPQWLTSRRFVSGSDDGLVKLWSAETLFFSIAHNVHAEAKEGVIGVCFVCDDSVASVGSSGVFVVWNTKVNNVRVENKLLRAYRPLCLAACPHRSDAVAVGTKQGVILVLSIADTIGIFFKVHGHDAEVSSMSWCPSSQCKPLEEVCSAKRVRIKSSKPKKQHSISNQSTPLSKSKSESVSTLDEKDPVVSNDESQLNVSPRCGLYEQTSGEEADESDIFDVYKDHNQTEFGHPKVNPVLSDSETDVDNKINKKPTNLEDPGNTGADTSLNKIDEDSDRLVQKDDFLEECDKLKKLLNARKERCAQDDNTSPEIEAVSMFKESREDSQEILDETDLFDVYKENTFEEFGHPKTSNKPSDSDVECEPKVPPSISFLEECALLKKKLTDNNDDDDDDLEEIDDLSSAVNSLQLSPAKDCDKAAKSRDAKRADEPNLLSNKILLASCCKNGKVYIWRWGGGLVASGSFIGETKSDRARKPGHPWGSVHWATSSLLMTVSKNSQLLRCNFQSMNSKRIFGYNIIHKEHVRGLFCIASAGNELADTQWRTATGTATQVSLIWSVGQDRMLVGYSVDQNKLKANYTTFGGYVNDIQISTIDPSRVAIGVGDGMVRVWERNTDPDAMDDMGTVKYHWNGVQGKVLCVTWHTTKENCLAFSTSEGRVGLLDAGSSGPAKVLPPGLPLGAHHICWGPRNLLFACGGGELVVYNTSHINQDPDRINIVASGRKWEVSTMVWSDSYLTVGSSEGGIGLLTAEHPYDVVVTAFPERKAIQCIAWHPVAVTTDQGVSPFANFIAIANTGSNFTVMKFINDSDEAKLEMYAEFSHHTERVFTVVWSPHYNGQLLTTSRDFTVQIWDIVNKCIVHTLSGHEDSVACAAWCPLQPHIVLTGGEDHTLRVWDITKHAPQLHPPMKRKYKRKLKLASVEQSSEDSKLAGGSANTEALPPSVQEVTEDASNEAKTSEGDADPPVNMAVVAGMKKKSQRKKSSYISVWKDLTEKGEALEGLKRVYKWFVANNSAEKPADGNCKIDYSDGYDYLRVYGTTEDVNELLDMLQSTCAESYNWDGWSVLGIVRGDIRGVLERAARQGQLCPALLSLSCAVSHKFWKEMMAAYEIQLERGDATNCNLSQMGCAWRGCVLLCLGRSEAACSALSWGGLHELALCAASSRCAPHLLPACLHSWLQAHLKRRDLVRAAECYLVLGQCMDAAITLGKSDDEKELLFAAEMAKFAGNIPLAEGISHFTSK